MKYYNPLAGQIDKYQSACVAMITVYISQPSGLCSIDLLTLRYIYSTDPSVSKWGRFNVSRYMILFYYAYKFVHYV
jgi:hypothetical protein